MSSVVRLDDAEPPDCGVMQVAAQEHTSASHLRTSKVAGISADDERRNNAKRETSERPNEQLEQRAAHLSRFDV